MRLTDLQDKQVFTLDGKRLGRVHELHCENGVLVALKVGPGGFIERMTARAGGSRLPWDSVRSIDDRRIVVTTGQPRRKRR